MPQVTVYIREGDIDLWRGIDQKSEFIHNALNSGEIKMAYDPATQTVAGKPIKSVLQTTPLEPTYEKVPVPLADKAPKIKVLDNDALKALLGGKATPIKDEPQHICKDNCKHWIWDTNSGKYNNSLTGEVRDAPEF